QSVKSLNRPIRWTPSTEFPLVRLSTYTIRITQPPERRLSILSTQAVKVVSGTPRNFPTIDGGSNPGTGSGKFVTFMLDKPVTLKPNTIYGFDINGGTDRHY